MKQPTSFILFLLTAFMATTLSFGTTVFAQSGNDIGSLQKEIEGLKKGQSQMRKDLAEIKKLIKQRPAAPKRNQPKPFKPSDLSIDGSPFLGQADAPVTMVEFTDYQCPFCKRHITRVFPQIKKDYIDTGKVKYVLREFPLKSIHPNAPKASAAALCAKDQGKYWEMHDKIFESPRKLAPADLKGHAESLGLDIAAFEGCIKADKYGKRIETDVQAGAKAGVRGTPSFFFGKGGSADAKKIRATQFLRGAQGYPQFKKVIDDLLAGKTGGAPTKKAAANRGGKPLTKEDYKKMGIQ